MCTSYILLGEFYLFHLFTFYLKSLKVDKVNKVDKVEKLMMLDILERSVLGVRLENPDRWACALAAQVTGFRILDC